MENLHDLEVKKPSEISSHGIGALEVLEYAKIGGYEIPDPIEIYGIQVKEINIVSEELTPEVATAVKELVNILKDRIIQLVS